MRIGRLCFSCVVLAFALPSGHVSFATAQSSSAFPGWNLGYELPAGWIVRQTAGRVHVLGSQNEAGAIFVAPGLYENVSDVLADMGAFLRLARISGGPTEGPSDTTLAGLPALVATVSGQNEHGRPVSARLAGVFTPHGTGVVTIGVATPPAFQDMRRTVASLAATVTGGPPQLNPEAARRIVGLWVRYLDGQPPSADPQREEERSIEDTIEFEEGGRFMWKSSIYLAAEARGRTNDPNTTAGESDRGVFRVVGEMLVLKGQVGQRLYPLTQSNGRLSLDGATYYRRD